MKSDGAAVRSKLTTIALVGNPNCGKTTLFNALTGGRQRIGNWPGVTVERKEGFIKGDDFSVRVIDLPGIYSFHFSSEDERIAQEYLLSGDADLVVSILDATHLERNLFLTMQLIEMDIPVVVALNMMDLVERHDMAVNTAALEKELGVPVVPLSATQKESVKAFRERLMRAVYNKPASSGRRTPYPDVIENWIDTMTRDSTIITPEGKNINRRLAVKLLEDPEEGIHLLGSTSRIPGKEIEEIVKKMYEATGQDIDIVIANSRFEFIHSIVERVVHKKSSRISFSERLDKIVLSRFLGIPIFLGVMYVAFWLAISVGSAFIDFFDILFGTVFVEGLGTLLRAGGSPAWLTTILAGGVGAGIQTVATFIPVIFFMFLVLSFLEDSGYMARAAFVMDRLMRAIGLPGKAFIPMIVGFGCTVPAILATRTLESRRDRFLTIFITPMMSCGARLPVYALFGAAFFGSKAGGIVFSLYFTGVLFALCSGLLLKRTLFRGTESHFVMELPEYHVPRFKTLMSDTWRRLKHFVYRAGKAIILVVLVIAFLNSLGVDGSFGNENTDRSVLSKIGKAITPVFRPMGIADENWPASVGLFTGLFAKEVTVGTLNALYSQNLIPSEGAPEDDFSLLGGIKESFIALGEGISGMFVGIRGILGTEIIGQGEEETAEAVEADVSIFSKMRDRFSPAGAYAYLLFVLLYFPCVAAFGAAVQEMGWKYGVLQAGYLTVLAWCAATLFFQIVEGHSLLFILLPCAIYLAMAVFFRLMGRNTSAL